MRESKFVATLPLRSAPCERKSANRAAYARTGERPVQEDWFSAHVTQDNWPKFGDSAVETIAEAISHHKERALGDSSGIQHRIVGGIVLLLNKGCHAPREI